jgi:hypothetical protein
MMGMELSWEVKEYLAGVIARESSGGIQIIGMRLGIDPKVVRRCLSNLQPMTAISMAMQALSDPYTGMSPQEKAAQYIVENTGNQDILIKTVFDAIKSRDDEIYTELNSIMERTMQCRMDEKWDIIPIFDPILQISEKRVYTERKLEEFGFNTTLTNYKSALKTYQIDYKGSISLFRSTFESLVDEIIISKGEILKSNVFKDKLIQLKKLGIIKEIKEIDTQQCQRCQYKKKDSEFNYSYDIYSLLSHYGPHPRLITKEVANFLFTSTLVFVWFLINRYENMETK